MSSSNNRRLAKNTIILYIRMIVVMFITLFTSRIILQALGVDDFGIYNVVGGVVTMMAVVNNAMAVSTQRYLTFELGKGDMQQFKKVFCTCMTIYMVLALLLVLLAETVGLWFVNSHLVIAPDRLFAANIVYQFAILSSICAMIQIPYNAAIISHEKMNAFAYIGIVEAVIKLAIAYVLFISPIDKLSLYGGLTFLSSFAIFMTYRTYCLRKFNETRYSFMWDKALTKQLVSYSGWNLFGALSGVAKGQGLNILINIYFGPAVNAARGIAYQLNHAITMLFTNFYTAVRPQITKYYAQKNYNEMYNLVYRSSKLSFFLILVCSLPLIMEAPAIVQLWLGQLPDYVVVFVRIIVIISAVDAMSTPLMTSIHASGDIKLYQFTVGMIMILTLPISWIFLKLGFAPDAVFYISLTLSTISLFIRLAIASKKTGIPFWGFIKAVILPSIIVSATALIPSYAVLRFIGHGIFATIVVCCISVVSVLFAAYFIGMSKRERNAINRMFLKKLKIRRK